RRAGGRPVRRRRHRARQPPAVGRRGRPRRAGAALAPDRGAQEGRSASAGALTMLPESAPLQVVAWIGTDLVHSTLLLTLAWALTRRSERLSLAAREGIWKLAVAGGFVTATLQIGL